MNESIVTDTKAQPNPKKSIRNFFGFGNCPYNYHHSDQSHFNLLSAFVRFALLIIVVVFAFLPYIRTEVLSARYTMDNRYSTKNPNIALIDTTTICTKADIEPLISNKDNSSDFILPKLHSTKIVEYERVRNSAKIYCLYNNSRYNTIKNLQLQKNTGNKFVISPKSTDVKNSTAESESWVWVVESSWNIRSLYWPVYY